MKSLRLAPLVLLCVLFAAPPASAQLLQVPGLPTGSTALPPLPAPNGLDALPTHGVDPFSIGLAIEVPQPAGGPSGAPLDTAVAVSADAVRKSEPTEWCGNEVAADDTADDAPNGDFRYHLIYAYPADGQDRFHEFASTLQTDAFQASSLIEREYGRAIRYDMGTPCGPQFIDISSLRLPQSTAQLQSLTGTSNATYQTVIDDLNHAGFAAISGTQPPSSFGGNMNWLVWLDGPAPTGCGQGTLYNDTKRDASNDNNAGGKLALVFREGTQFCNSNALRHEVGHNLGSVVPSAPHYDGTSHCNDARGDTMCLTGPAGTDPNSFQALYFDYNDDDYWDPPGGQLAWWAVDLNRFLCPGIACDVPGGVHARSVVPSGAPGSGGTLLRFKLTASHHGKRWRFKLRVPGSGKARVTVSCRLHRRSHRLLRRSVRLPATVRGKGLCDRRPAASVKHLRR